MDDDAASATPRQKTKVRISTGSNRNNLTVCNVNTEVPVVIDNDHFQALIVVRINEFEGIVDNQENNEPVRTSPYFDGVTRKFSIQIQGRFKHTVNGDDLIWDTHWDTPIKVPALVGPLVKFIRTIDPATDCDLYAPQPYWRTTVLTSFNAMAVWKLPAEKEGTEVLRPVKIRMEENNGLVMADGKSVDVGQRRKYFSAQKNRRSVDFGTDAVYAFELFNPFFDVQSLTVKVPMLPKINIRKYTEEQPMYFTMKDKEGNIYFTLEIAHVEA
ncbi:hypothetical protein HK104_000735 [Borealophlyctis nickersoniae]|nr:hypothetical protein HK104_000735 [Borealophlyctis nickersoniae]